MLVNVFVVKANLFIMLKDNILSCFGLYILSFGSSLCRYYGAGGVCKIGFAIG